MVPQAEPPSPADPPVGTQPRREAHTPTGQTPRRQTHLPGKQTPQGGRHPHPLMVNERSIRILLECILVKIIFTQFVELDDNYEKKLEWGLIQPCRFHVSSTFLDPLLSNLLEFFTNRQNWANVNKSDLVGSFSTCVSNTVHIYMTQTYLLKLKSPVSYF